MQNLFHTFWKAFPTRVNATKTPRFDRWILCWFLELGICSTSAILELYLFSKFLHFEEIVRVKMAVCFEMIVSET